MSQYRQANYVAALALVRQGLQVSPAESALHVVAAAIQLHRDALFQAEQELREARKDGAQDQVVLPMLLDVMVARHEEVNLLTEFSEPPSNAKGSVTSDILRGRASASLSLGNFADAAVSMDRSLSLRRDPEGLLIRADVASKLGDNALAGKLVDEAFQMAPKDGVVMMSKLKRLEQANDAAAALALSDQVLKLDPANTGAREIRIRIFLQQKQDGKAEAEVARLQAGKPKMPLGIYYTAVLMSHRHDVVGASQMMQGLTLQFVRDRPDLAVQMARIVLDNGNVESGAAILGAAIGADPGLLDARLRLAALRLEQGSPQSALGLLTPVQDSKDLRVRKLLGDVRARIAKDRAF
jgi:tetratricopeptide (TPR) repeat protein